MWERRNERRDRRAPGIGSRRATAMPLVAVAVSLLVLVPSAMSGAAPNPPVSPGGPVTGQITAHDGKFWKESTSILLHGINANPIEPTDLTSADYAKIASWHMNFVRLQIHWGDVEPTAPIKSGNTWTHRYDATDIAAIKDQITLATQNGLYVLVENALATFYPAWMYTAPYNSHGKNYVDSTALSTDYWSDSLMQRFTRDYLTTLAVELAGMGGVVGFEPIDEASPGTLPINHTTTQLLLDTQLSLAQAVRAVDPNRVLFFTTHESLGFGLPNANLSGWQTLGNVAYDVHDYFGGRWGVGVIMDPASPDFGEGSATMLGFTLNTANPPYLGTTDVQVRFLQNYLPYLAPKGIPLLIGEFGGRGEDEPNILALFGTMTQAFNQLNLSWAAWSYNEGYSVTRENGTNEPWVPILSAAAAYPG
jgi:hypothetical protein